MPEEAPNPLMQGLLRMVSGRENAEVAKLALLTEIASKLGAIVDELEAANVQRAELLDRAKER